MPSQFGSARKLYDLNTHPRIFFGPGELQALRLKARKGIAKRIMEALRKRTDLLVQRVSTWPDLAETLAHWNDGWQQPATQVMWKLHEIALVGVLDEKPEHIETVRRVLMALPEAIRLQPRGLERFAWGYPPTLAVAYDLIWDHVPAAERASFNDWAARTLVHDMKEVSASRYYRSAGVNGNIGYMEPALLMALALQGSVDDELIAADLAQCVSFLEATLHCAIGPDGYPEEDIGYGTAVVAELAYMVEAVYRAGLLDPYRTCPRYTAFGNAVLHFVQPWGEFLTNTGDHGDGFWMRELILPRLATATSNPTLLWLLGTLSYPGVKSTSDADDGMWDEVLFARAMNTPPSALSLIAIDDFKKPVHPAKAGIPTQFHERGRGIVSFRSGWNADDTLLVFDGSQRSPAAPGHHHSSAGHFSLTALGEYFAIDTGRYNGEQNCHNVVLVNGKSGRSTDGEWRMAYHHGNLIGYAPGDFVDFAAVDSSMQHDCYWARRYVGLVKGRGAPAYAWAVDDINKANDWAEFWWQLHTSPENTITINRHEATIKGWRQGNLLQVHFALPNPTAYPKPHTITLEQDIATPNSYKYIPNPHERAKAFQRPSDMIHGPVYVRPRLLGKVAGYNGRFMSVMIPRLKGSRPVKVERLDAIDNILAVRISFDAVEDTLIFAYEHNLLEAGDVSARGQWCVVRRARKSGKVQSYAVGDGTRLAVAGTPLQLR